jgi:cation-transporting ATPase E
VVGVATFVSYLAAYQGREATAIEQTQASTAALITLLVTAVWVLAVVARPYEWWRVALVTVSGLAYVVIFSIPVAQKTFMVDPSNMAITSIALGIGVAGAAIIEVLWWVQGALLGERRRLWRTS